MNISITIPVFNGSKTIEKLVNEINENLDNLNLSYEIFLIDDFSTDNSWACIENLCKKYNFVKGIKLKSNYGQHNATMAGLNYCSGNFTIIMDDDLQHNPKYILKIINKLKEGYDLCYCNFIERKHTIWKITVSIINNLILSLGTSKPFNIYASPYRGVSKSTYLKVIKNKANFIFLDVLILNTKPKLNKIDIFHEKRAEGVTQYNFFKLFKLWFQMFASIKLNLLNLIIFFFPKLIAHIFLLSVKIFSQHKNQYIIEKKLNLND
tara:strand:- start:2603 stop:3397 length:795 start_codon:yes stop_codon:yes gene_type:complete